MKQKLACGAGRAGAFLWRCRPDPGRRGWSCRKIGVPPLTGQNAFGGQLELEGVRLAHKEMPTVLGRPVDLVVVDNKSDKVEAANAVKRLVERDKVVALIGTYGSSLAMAGAKWRKGQGSRRGHFLH